KKPEAAEVRRHCSRPGFKFCQFPVSVLNALITQRANWTAFAVLVALHELWFTHPNHYNPVELASRKLLRLGLSKGQKYRGLKSLEKSGQISVERRARKNPLVTLNWLLSGTLDEHDWFARRAYGGHYYSVFLFLNGIYLFRDIFLLDGIISNT